MLQLWSAQIWPVCNKGITQFYLPPTHKPYMLFLPSYKASQHFGWYSLCLPTKGWLGWVDLGGWLHTEIDVPHWELNPDTVTCLSTNRARRRLTSLIETTVLPLCQTATHVFVESLACWSRNVIHELDAVLEVGKMFTPLVAAPFCLIAAHRRCHLCLNTVIAVTLH